MRAQNSESAGTDGDTEAGAVPGGRYRGRSREERRAERRDRFLEAGLELYGTGGYGAATVERICTVAGLSTRQFYEEFAGRDELLLALYDSIHDRAARAVDAVTEQGLADDLDVLPLLRAAIAAYLVAMTTDPRCAQVAYVTVVGASPRIEEHRQARRVAWTDVLCTLAAEIAGRDNLPVRDNRLAMRAFVGAVNELAHLWCRPDFTGSLDDIIDTLAHMLHGTLLGGPGDG